MRSDGKRLIHFDPIGGKSRSCPIGYAAVVLLCLFGCFCLFGCSSEDEMETVDDELIIDDPDALLLQRTQYLGSICLQFCVRKNPQRICSSHP